MPQGSPLGSFKHCIDGAASDAEAEEVGLTLGKRFYELKFDASIFSDACIDKILPHTFGTYDEVTSLQLVRFFWTDAFLSRLLEVSISKPGGLSCSLSCLLSLDQRRVPTLALFPTVVGDLPRLTTPDNAFLPAAALLTAQHVAPERTSRLLDSIDNVSLRENVIRVLYLIGDVSFIRRTFRESRDPARLCVAEKCVAIATAKSPANCEEIYGAVAAAKTVGGLDGIVALKIWALNSGKDLVKNCVVTALGEPLEQAALKTRVYTNTLFVLDPSFEGDIVNGFKEGLFKNFNFLDQDISELSNIEFSRMRTLSSPFARRIVDQLEADPAALAMISGNLGAEDLIAGMPSGARFTFLLCEHRHSPGRAACSREDIYLSVIRELIR